MAGASCWRTRLKSRGVAVNDSGLPFDESVPMMTIEVTDPALEAIPESGRVAGGLPAGAGAGELPSAAPRAAGGEAPDTGELVSSLAPGSAVRSSARLRSPRTRNPRTGPPPDA